MQESRSIRFESLDPARGGSVRRDTHVVLAPADPRSGVVIGAADDLEDLGHAIGGLGPGAWGLGPGAWGLGPGAWGLGPGPGPGAWGIKSGARDQVLQEMQGLGSSALQ